MIGDTRIACLIAGIGNVFKGDDAFGVEVVRRLAGRELLAPASLVVGMAPEISAGFASKLAIDIVDFGINGIDLLFALVDRYDAALLIDTTQRGGAPGTLYVIEPEMCPEDATVPTDFALTPHELDPFKVLRMVRLMDGRCRKLVLLGCEPADFGDEWQGKMGLTEEVAVAVEEALGLIDERLEAWFASSAQTFGHQPIESAHTWAGGAR